MKHSTKLEHHIYKFVYTERRLDHVEQVGIYITDHKFQKSNKGINVLFLRSKPRILEALISLRFKQTIHLLQ